MNFFEDENNSFMESNFGLQFDQQRNDFNVNGLSSSQKFCNEGNVGSCLMYLNQELVGHGMNQMFDDPHQFHISSLVNVTFELLQKIHHSVASKDVLEEGRHKALCEIEQLQAEKKRLKLRLEASERDAITYKNKVDCLYKELADKEMKIKNEKDEVRSLQSQLRSMELQHKNAMKKEEREMNRFKDKLGSLMSEKSERRPGSKVSDSFLKELRKRNDSNLLPTNMEIQECQNFHDDLKLLHESICTYKNKFLKNVTSDTLVSDLKSEHFGTQDASEDASLQNSEVLLKNIDEQITRLNQKFDKRFAATGRRHALQDKNSSTHSSFSYQQASRTKCVNKGGGDSTLRPKSAIQFNRKNLESKERISRNVSMMASNSQKFKSQPSTLGKKLDRMKHEAISIEDKGYTKRSRPLIRSESYTILKDHSPESGCEVILEDVMFGVGQSTVRNDLNKTFVRRQSDFSDDCYI